MIEFYSNFYTCFYINLFQARQLVSLFLFVFLIKETHWEWVTGEPWSFEKWRQREPNNWGKAEHCLNTNFVRPGLWNDHFCQNKKASICEMFPIVDAITAGGDRV